MPAGRRLLEGNRLVAADGDLVRSRTKAIYNGAAVVTIVLEQARRNVRDVLLSAIGLVDSGEDGVVHGIRSAASRAVVALSERHYRDDDAVREAVRIAVRRECRKLIDKRPLAHVHLVRV